jgi:hypothetical protein
MSEQKQPDQGHAPGLAHERRDGEDSTETTADAGILACDGDGLRKT